MCLNNSTASKRPPLLSTRATRSITPCGSSMKQSNQRANAASIEAAGRSRVRTSATATSTCCKPADAARCRRKSANFGDPSTAKTRPSAPTRSASSKLVKPGPQPRSRIACPVLNRHAPTSLRSRGATCRAALAGGAVPLRRSPTSNRVRQRCSRMLTPAAGPSTRPRGSHSCRRVRGSRSPRGHSNPRPLRRP